MQRFVLYGVLGVSFCRSIAQFFDKICGLLCLRAIYNVYCYGKEKTWILKNARLKRIASGLNPRKRIWPRCSVLRLRFRFRVQH